MNEEGGDRLFSVVPTNRKMYNEYQLKQRKFQQQIQENTFKQGWSNIRTSCLERLKSVADHTLSRADRLGDLKSSLPTSTMLCLPYSFYYLIETGSK